MSATVWNLVRPLVLMEQGGGLYWRPQIWSEPLCDEDLERLRKLRYRDPLKTPPSVQGEAEKRREAYQLIIFALAESTEAKHEAES